MVEQPDRYHEESKDNKCDNQRHKCIDALACKVTDVGIDTLFRGILMVAIRECDLFFTRT